MEQTWSAYAHSAEPGAADAVAALRRELGDKGVSPSVLLVFCSATYDLPALARALRETFVCPVVGCTSAGQMGPSGFVRGGISAIALDGQDLQVTTYPVENLAEPTAQARILAHRVNAALPPATAVRDSRPPLRSFGLLLMDGLCMKEEGFAGELYRALRDVPFVGGSAGDDLHFEQTHVLVNGEFRRNAATFTVVTTRTPFSLVKTQHFRASSKLLVITEADPATRRVLEINGLPATQAYAELVGVGVEELTPTVFSRFPLVYSLGDEPYLRAIQRAHPDGSLSFFCSMDRGAVLSVGQRVDAAESLVAALDKARDEMGAVSVVIGCDCILRRLEFEAEGNVGRVGALMAERKVCGLSTYGEQFNGVHVNQTFTGIALGA